MKRRVIIKVDIDQQAIQDSMRHKSIDHYMQSVLGIYDFNFYTKKKYNNVLCKYLCGVL